MVDTEIKATFTADTQDFTRGTARAAKDLARVAGEADHAEGQTDDLGDAVARLAREFSRGAADALKEARALSRMSEETRHTANQVDQLTGEARKARRELQRLDGMNVEPDVKVGRIRGAFRGLHSGFDKLGGVLGKLAGQIPAVGGGLEKIGTAAPGAAVGLAAVAAAAGLLALPFALAGGAAAGAALAIGGLSALAAHTAGGKDLAERWGVAATVMKDLGGQILSTLIPTLEKVATAVVPAVVTAAGQMETWWRANNRAVADFLVNLVNLGLVGVAAVAHLAAGLLRVLGPALAWVVRAIGALSTKWGDLLEGLSKVPGFGWLKTVADDLHRTGEAAGPMADSIETGASLAADALGIVANGAEQARLNLESMAGNYSVTVHAQVTGDRGLITGKHRLDAIGGGGHLGINGTSALSGPMPAAPAGPTPTGRSGAPVVNLTQPRAGGGAVVHVDARGAVGLDLDRLGRTVVAALERYEGRNGARWRGGTARWRIT